MIVVALVLAALAALLHVFIFYLESIAWTTPRARAVFGITAEEATATRGMALNQGFYNLFLAILAGLGVILVAAGQFAVGATLLLAGTGSMAAAALVLFLADPTKRQAALKQGTLPVLAILALITALLLR